MNVEKKKKKKEGDRRNGIEVGSENELNRIHSFFLSCCIIIISFFLLSFFLFFVPFPFSFSFFQLVSRRCTLDLHDLSKSRGRFAKCKYCLKILRRCFLFIFSSFFSSPSFHQKHDVGIKGWKRSWIESGSDKARLVIHTVSNNFYF